MQTNQFKQKGRIELILGPMFSGKSTELVRIIKRHRIANKKCLIINHQLDDRYSAPNYVATHDRIQMEAMSCTSLIKDVIDRKVYEDYDVIGIDEGQFFQDAVQGCETLAQLGKVVIVASLDGTFQRKPFGCLLNLIPLAEKVRKLSAICKECSDNASFTLRLTKNDQSLSLPMNCDECSRAVNSQQQLAQNLTNDEKANKQQQQKLPIQQEEKIELIGGEELYKPVCRQCYYKHGGYHYEAGIIQSAQSNFNAVDNLTNLNGNGFMTNNNSNFDTNDTTNDSTI
eukprot:403340224